MTRRMMLASLAALLAASFCTAAENKPVLVVFKFERVNCRAKDSRFVTKGIFDKASRLLEFTMIDPMSRDDTVASAGFKPKYDTPIDQMASLIKDAFAADIGVWGKVERQGQRYIINAKCLDVRKSATELKFDKRYEASGPRTVRMEVERIVDALGAKKKIKETFRFKEEEDGIEDPSLDRPNLVPNPSFEKGRGDHPTHWWRVNGLTTFWIDRKDGQGKCIRMDTDVLEAEVLPWLDKWRKGAPASQAPTKTIPTKAQQYATIGGTHGVHYKSEGIPIKQGVKYRVSFDMKGKWAGMFFPKVWVKGFASFSDKGGFGDQDREVFRMYKACRTKTAGREWEHFTRPFNPTQWLAVLDFQSTGGQDQLAREIPSAIRAFVKKNDMFPMIEYDVINKGIKEANYIFDFAEPIQKIFQFTDYHLRAQLVIYGIVGEADGRTFARVRAATLRQKQFKPLVEMDRDINTKADIAKLAEDVVKKLRQKIALVKWIRIEAYGYWPRGVYHWDNFRITEEGVTGRTE